MNWLLVAKILLELLPAIIDGIKALEKAMPEAGQGAAKLNALRALLQGAYETGEHAAGAFEALWPTISRVVGSLVDTFNRSGMFKRD